jgi:hypothetical protein
MAELKDNQRTQVRVGPERTLAGRSGRLDKWVQSLPQDVSQRKPSQYSPELASVQASALRARSQWEDLKEQAVLAFESGLLPRSVDTRERAVTIALMGKELGVAPMQALCGIYVVNGMMALRGGLMLRLIYERVPGARITVLTPPDKSEQECAVEMQRPNGNAQVFRFTVEDARRAGFMGKPIWQQHTGTMLRWAAIRTGARVVFADAIAGCYMEDEIPASDTASMPVETPVIPPQQGAVATAPAEAAVTAGSEEAKAAPQPEAAQQELAHAPQPVPQPSSHRPRTVVSAMPRTVTEKQVSRLYAIAYQKKWNRQEVSAVVDKWFHKKEPRLLNRAEYDRLCQHLLESGSKDILFDKNQASEG